MTKSGTQIDWRRVRADLERRLTQPRTSFSDDPEAAEAILRERRARLAVVPTRRARPHAHFLAFACGDTRFGLPLTALREVVRLDAVARVPGAVAAARGIMGWRGEFVTVFDARSLVTMPPSDAAPAFAAVFRGTAPFIALAFDRADGIVKFDMSALRGPSEWQSRAPDLFLGALNAVALFDAAVLSAQLRQYLRAA